MSVLINNQKVKEFTLSNKNGMEVSFLNYGCIITKIIVPDRDGNFENVVLGFNDVKEYEHNPHYFGAIIGRFAGRIKKGEISLKGHLYSLKKNDGNNHLHGGETGFHQVFWKWKIIDNGVLFTHESPDGDQGYPGNLHINITYTLNDENEFSICYQGISDQPTLLNLTNHTYFNLSGNLKHNIKDHILTLKSDNYIELDDELLPTGMIKDVTNSTFDFREGKKIREGIELPNNQNIIAGYGYDHPFLLNKHNEPQIQLVEKGSGRVLSIQTNEKCVVVYSGTQLSEDNRLSNVNSTKYLGLCLETQGVPDAIHHSHFPQCILEANKLFTSSTTYGFSTDSH
jgi:aldose 1-epimerase